MVFKGGTNKNKIINDIHITPEWLSNKIYKSVNRKGYKNILDIGCNIGNLSKPFNKLKDVSITGVDIDDYANNFNYFIHKPFLETVKEDYETVPNLIISNPPFSNSQPMQFIEHISKLWGDIPIIMIVPSFILDNSYKRAQDLMKLHITRNITLDTFTFSSARLHTHLLYINIKFKNVEQFEFWHKPKIEEVKKSGKVRSIYTNKSDEYKLQVLLKSTKGNFNQLIKTLIEKEYNRLNN